MPKVPRKDRSGNEEGGDPPLDGLVLRLVRRGESEREREKFRKGKRKRTAAKIDKHGVARSDADVRLQGRINTDPELAELVYGWADPDEAYGRMLAELRRVVNWEPPGGQVPKARMVQIRNMYEAIAKPLSEQWKEALYFESVAVLKARTPGAGKTASTGPQPLGLTVVHGPVVELAENKLRPGDKSPQRRGEAGAQTSGFTILRRLKENHVGVPEKLTDRMIDRALEASTLTRGGGKRRNIAVVIDELIQKVSK